MGAKTFIFNKTFHSVEQIFATEIHENLISSSSFFNHVVFIIYFVLANATSDVHLALCNLGIKLQLC